MHCSVSDVSEMLGVGSETVRRWIRDGKLQAKRARGRNGSEISLEEVVRFSNHPPCLYQDSLRTWLERHGIQYDEEYRGTTAGEDSKSVMGKIAAVAAGTATAVSATAALSPFLGTAVGIPAVLGAAGAAGAKTKTLLNQKPTVYRQLHLRSIPTEPETETTSIQDTDLPESSLAELQENFAPSSEETDPKEALRNQIRAEKLKLVQLRQEQAQIEARITICEKQIEYYEILLAE